MRRREAADDDIYPSRCMNWPVGYYFVLNVVHRIETRIANVIHIVIAILLLRGGTRNIQEHLMTIKLDKLECFGSDSSVLETFYTIQSDRRWNPK